MWSWSRTLLLIAFLLGAFGAQADEMSDLDVAIQGWFQRADHSPAYLHEQGVRIESTTRTCDSTLLAYALKLRAHNDAPDQFERPELDSARCPRSGMLIPREEAYTRFYVGKYLEATTWFERALEAARRKSDRASLMQSLGTCYYLSDDMEQAFFWYEESTQYGTELLSAISLSNLSLVNLALGKPAASIEWSARAEERLLEELADGLTIETYQLRRDLLLLNKCLAHLDLNQVSEAEAAFSKMDLTQFFPGMGLEFVLAAFILASALDDAYPIEVHRESFSRVAAMDSLAAVERLGPVLLLLDPWRTLWDAEPNAPHPWSVLQSLDPSELPHTRGPEIHLDDLNPEEPRPLWVWMLGWIGCVVGLGVTGWQWRIRPRRPTIGVDGLRTIRSALVGSTKAGRNEALNTLKSLAYHQPLWRASALSTNWTRREIEILQSMVDQERAKATAERLGISAKSVYMLRTEVRKKIELEEGESLEDWLKRFTLNS